MLKVNNGKCIRNISIKSLRSNRRRNIILIAAIAITAVLLTALFTIGGSIMKSIEESTMYQVGTSSHGGFKFLTEEQYEKVAADSEVKDISYNVLVGFAVNEELGENYSEVRYAEEKDARWSFSYPSEGRLPEKINEAAVPTEVLDCYGLPHETGQIIRLTIKDGDKEITERFKVCGIWEKPSATMANEIYVSKAFQEKYAPVWKTAEDYDKHMNDNMVGGSINPSLWFGSDYDIESQMDNLKKRCGFDKSVNEGVNWGYAASSVDFSSLAIVVFILLIVLISGYLIIYNIFYISVSEDIHFYGLLKTIGTTRRQLKSIVHRQALILSAIGIPIGLILGYLLSIVILPVISENLTDTPCSVHGNIWIFILSGLFALITVWISCIKPCRFVNRISPVEAVRFTEVSKGRKKKKKTRKVSPVSMAWENVLRTPAKTAAVVLSLSLSVMLINTTVSLVEGFDEDKYISNYAVTDFCVTDRSIDTNTSLDVDTQSITPEDMDYLRNTPGLTDFGIVYMSECQQKFSGEKLEQLKGILERRRDDFTEGQMYRWYRKQVYEEHTLASHIYGVNEFAAGLIESRDGAADGIVDWDKFKTGRYVIVSAYGSNGEEPYYEKGETIPVNLPDGTVKEYEVMAVGDLAYAMTVQHGHGIDIYIQLPESEYLAHCPDTAGAMRVGFNVRDDYEKEAEEYVSDYCENIHKELAYSSKQTYAESFDDLVKTYLIVGFTLSFILGLIAVLNFINLTITSINSRKKEIGILRAVGMTEGQLKNMFVWEGLFKLIMTGIFTLTIGQVIMYGAIKVLTGSMWMFRFTFVIWPLAAGLVLFAILAYIIPSVCCRRVTGEELLCYH
ncbi:MAG: ABC transporter permease [Lentihominibacter sp.]